MSGRPGAANAEGSKRRVLIVDDQRLFAEAIRNALSQHALGVAKIAGTAADAMEAVESDPPDIVLLDLGLPDEDGLVLGQRILAAHPSTKIVIVSALADARALRTGIRAGFHGYLTKDTPLAQLVTLITAILEGHVVMPPQLARTIAGARSPEDEHAALLAAQLTERERAVLALLVEGASSSIIAQRLSISPNTVRTHIQNLLTKLEAHTRLEAAAFAVRQGLVEPQGRRHRRDGAERQAADPMSDRRARAT